MKHSKQGTELLNRLAETGDRLVVIKEGSVLFNSREPGIKPLLEAIHGIPAAKLRGAGWQIRSWGMPAPCSWPTQTWPLWPAG